MPSLASKKAEFFADLSEKNTQKAVSLKKMCYLCLSIVTFMQFKTFFLLALLTCCPLAAKASTPHNDSLPHWGASLGVLPGRVVALDDYTKKWLHQNANLTLKAELHYADLPPDSSAFASDYNYPTLSIGLKYALNHGVVMHRYPDEAWGKAQEVPYDSHLGNSLTLYGIFARPLLRTQHWELDYSLGAGIGYNRSKYNPRNNIDNELIGSRWLIYFTAGIHGTYRFAADWGVKAGVEFYHHSNGALNRPNKGANVLAPMLGITYMPYYGLLCDRTKNRVTESFQKYWFLNLTAGLGGKTLLEEWQKTQFDTEIGRPDYRTDRFQLYASYSLKADVMRRYARRWASGLGVDLYYGTYASRVKALDEAAGRREKHSPLSLGISAKHEVYYKNLSVNVALGWYLYRKMGYNAQFNETPYYEYVGLRYNFAKWKGLGVGFNVKAHATKADVTELVLSCPVVFSTKK